MKPFSKLSQSNLLWYEGMKVFIYFNLHKKCWSIRYKGKVIGHTDNICLKNVQFKVSQSGRLRVLQEQRKNVHAGCYGTIESFHLAQERQGWTPVTYNPYKFETFVTKSDNQPVYQADMVTMGIQEFDAKRVPMVLAHNKGVL